MFDDKSRVHLPRQCLSSQVVRGDGSFYDDEVRFVQYSPKITHAHEVAKEVLPTQEVQMRCFAVYPQNFWKRKKLKS